MDNGFVLYNNDTYYMFLLSSNIFYKTIHDRKCINNTGYWRNVQCDDLFIDKLSNTDIKNNNYHLIKFKVNFLDIIYNNENDLLCL